MSSESLVPSEKEEILFDNSEWVYLPENVVLQILFYLSPREILNVGICCKRYNRISKDDYLWRKFFQRDFKVEKNIQLKPGAESWAAEYERLSHNIPMVLTDILTSHSHQVLHVSFSHNGKMFATCSKDGFVIIWDSSYPSTIKYSHDMKSLSWKYTQYSQFNESDTLLLVSGVHFGTPHSTSGEIAVFSVQDGSHLKCRVVNRPYDIFGTWFSDQHLLSGDLHWLAHLVSTSVLWLNKANQEIDSEHVPIMNQLYKFYNRNASSIRAIMIANCPWLQDQPAVASTSSGEGTSSVNQSQPHLESDDEDDGKCAGNPLSHIRVNYMNPRVGCSSSDNYDFPYRPLDNQDYASPIHYLDEFRREYEDNYAALVDLDQCPGEAAGGKDTEEEEAAEDDDQEDMDEDESDTDELDDPCPKYLIFSTGSKTYTPHQIGFKRIGKINFPRRLDPGPSLKERIALTKRKRELENSNEPRVEPNWANYDAVSDRFDKVDKLIDLHGHIIGMGLSPDHRYLYVNSRPWPQNYIIRNPLEPPPIAQEIDIHVIDLATLKKVGNMLRAHKAYTPNTECFFIFLDVCDSYVASGAEDKHAYLWDRFYGVCLAKYQHGDVVNSVAFNPKDNEMLVTTSDDYEIKVWRSAAQAKSLGISVVGRAEEFRRKK